MHTWATGGGKGGHAPLLAAKNLSPPLDPKIRDLTKIEPGKGNKKLISFFKGFLREDDPFAKKTLLFFLSYFLKNHCFLLQIYGLSPPTPPLGEEKVSPPLEPFWGV